MAVDHNNPQSRDEEILIATIDGKEYNKAPQSRMEELLLELKERFILTSRWKLSRCEHRLVAGRTLVRG